MSLESHHLLFPKRPWRSQEPTKTLRHIQWLKPTMDAEAHNALHRNVPLVPVPGYIMGQRILRLYEPVEGDYIRSITELMNVIEHAPRTTPQLELQLGQLIIESLSQQLPYIVQGIVDTTS